MKMNRQPGQPPRIEMMPLIDVVFLLLVFFIYAMLSMAVQHGLHLDLPESSQSQDGQEKVIAVSVRRSGTGLEVYLNKEALSLDLLGKHLESLVHSVSGKKPEVALFAEKSISYQELFMVLDRIRASGVASISLQAEAEQ